MTRDEILHMPAGRKIDALVAEKVMNDPPEYQGRYSDFYSLEIAAAWQVVEKMLVDKDGKENKFHLYRYFRGVKRQRVTWRCAFGPGSDNLLEYSEADTVPLAICRAALLSHIGAE